MGKKNPSTAWSITPWAHEHAGFCDDFYAESARGEKSDLLKQGYDVYYGRNVLWLGREGEMLRAKPEYIVHMPDNIFQTDKLAAVVDCIKNTPSRVPFIAPVADAHVIDPTDVQESIQYAADEELDRPLTTGNEDVDAWLAFPEEFYERELGVPERWDDETEYQMALADLEADMAAELEHAVLTRQGDLGEVAVQIRDGNHRAFGALAAGEPYVYVWLVDWALQDIRDGLRPELAEQVE